jgi:hypothetical protein
MFFTQVLSVAVDQRPYAREGVYYRRYWDRPPHAASFPGRLLVSPESLRNFRVVRLREPWSVLEQPRSRSRETEDCPYQGAAHRRWGC